MLRNLNIRTKSILIFLLIIIFTILIVSYTGFFVTNKSIRNIRIETLESIADLKVDAIEKFFDVKIANLETAQGYYNIKHNLPILAQFANDKTDPAYIRAKNMLDDQLGTFQKIYGYLDVMLADKDGRVIYVSNESHIEADIDRHLSDIDGKAFINGIKGTTISHIFLNKIEGNDFEILITAPVCDFNETIIGIIALEVDMGPVYKLIQDTTGLGKTGETLVASNNGNYATFLSPLRHDQDAALHKIVTLGGNNESPLQKAVKGRKGAGLSVDYRGNETIAAWRYIPSLDWGLVAKVDTSEAFAIIYDLAYGIFLITSIILSIAIILAIIFAKSITDPIRKLSDVAHKINNGDLKIRADIKPRNEIGKLAESFNQMTNRLVDSKVMEEKKAIQLMQSNVEYELLLSSIPSIIIELSNDYKICRWNRSAEHSFGIVASAVIGLAFRECKIQWDWNEIFKKISLCKDNNNATWIDNFKYERIDGNIGNLGITINPIKNGEDELTGILISMLDITERKNMERQLLHAQKMEAIGQLAAGIAHEINTPTQYISNNISYLQDAFGKATALLNQYSHLLEMNKAGAVTPEFINETDVMIKDINVEYLIKEVPEALKESLDGLKRVTEIVQSLKIFSHPDHKEKELADINEMIKSTITVSRNEWKYVADIESDFSTDLPLVPCYPGEFNQAILNLIINAAHAIGEVSGNGDVGNGEISVSTQLNGDWAEIHISDTGGGIPEDIRSRIFDPFFTTKEVGRGTGQGLSIVHSIVVKKHNGTITFDTITGEGTTFKIRLPINQSLSEKENSNEKANTLC